MSDHHLAKELSLSLVHDSGIRPSWYPKLLLSIKIPFQALKHTPSKFRSLPRLFLISLDCLPGFWFLLFSFFALLNDTFFFHICVLCHIRASLTTEASKIIAVAIVGSRLDYCNSLLAGTSISNLTRVQRVQNTLARVVAQKPRFCHITPFLSDLHWLPVCHRISFKIATVTFRVLQFQQPTYLAPLIPKYVPARALCSSSVLSICVPPRKTTIAASKSFSSVASNIWNSLPNHLSYIPALPAFRRALKHHLFLLAYPYSGAKSGKIKPAQYITLRDTPPTTAIAQPGNTMPPI